MKRKLLVSVSAAMLGLLFVLPLWKISLVVPQYPKDIAILIHINKIADASPKALMILNVLNHNVGMKEIVPEDFTELRTYPVAVISLIVLGFVSVWLVPWKVAAKIWFGLLTIACMIALYDFYYWLSDFGNNLDPEAALKIEGQSFQPPVLGIRKVVNLEVHSFPSWGVLAIGSGLLFGLLGILTKVEK